MKDRAVYPGSFDPVTNGHLDIIQRSAPLVGELIVAIADNPNKRQLFSLEERLAFLREVTSHIPNVVIDSFNTLLVDYIRERKIPVVVRGLRAMTDFENEFQMALINKSLCPESETIFMVTSAEFSFLSSSAIKEVASFGGDVSRYVAPSVGLGLAGKYGTSGGVK